MIRRLALVALCSALVFPTVGARASTATCDASPAAGGEWRSYGNDVRGTRHQDAGTGFSALEVATLAPAWTFSSSGAGGDGDFTGTPIVAGDCVYIGSNTGWVYAIDVASGALRWKTKLDAPSAPGDLFPSGIPSTLAVHEGRVYANVNRVGTPYLAALHASNGELDWTATVSTAAGASLYSSPIAFGDLVFVGVSSPSNSSSGAGGASGRFVLIDAETGVEIERTSVIPQEDLAEGYGGAGIWSTPAIDEEAGYAYVGTGEPDEGAREHEHANAIIKIDVDPTRATFGEIVGSYKNNVYAQIPGFSSTDPHFDFGASPNLFTDASGRKLVGCLQRAGVYHALDAGTMQGVWTAVVAPTQVLGNAGSSAFDGTAVHGSVNPGTIYSLERSSGTYRWASSSADGIRYQPVASAHGVVYTVDLKGFLDAYDAATGAPLLHRPMVLGSETGTDPASSLGGGVSIAQGTVFAAVGLGLNTGINEGYLIAYRPA